MAIVLTCTCGHKNAIASASEPRAYTCSACGNSLKVPALGVLETSRPRPTPKALVKQESGRRWLLPVAFGVLLAIAAGITAIAWWWPRERPDEPTPIVQNHHQVPPPRAHDDPKPVERPKPEQEKKSPPPVIDPVPIEKKVPPKEVTAPIKPTPEPPKVTEPVAQVGELPNPFLLPRIEDKPPVKVVEKKPPNVTEPIQLVWNLKANDAFYQELVVTQKPTFKIPPGIVVQSVLQYGIVSRFTVKKVEKDGSLVVEQRIEGARLLQADDLTKSVVAGPIMQLPKTTFTLHLNAKMEVTKLEGNVGGPKATQIAGGMGMQMTSLIDRDGWKELAQATFFQMEKPLKVKDRWQKPMTHNWGALGSWQGQIGYLYFGKQDNFHKVGFQLQLAYKAPGAGAVGLLKINGATFQPPQAEGMLLFDSVKGKVVAAEERFRVRGLLNVNLLGQATQIEVEEDQHFAIRIHDQEPRSK